MMVRILYDDVYEIIHSMHSSFYETITQLFNLVFFCKQIKLPYKAYAFSDRIVEVV